MSPATEFTVRLADWPRERDAIMALRTAVFVNEQHVPIDEEYDGRDDDSLHVVAETGAGEVIGTGRLLPEGRIGRMAVARSWRARGVGRQLLEALVAQARGRRFDRVELHAQVPAIGFYERSGFRAEGPVFDDAGIPHRTMHLGLESTSDE